MLRELVFLVKINTEIEQCNNICLNWCTKNHEIWQIAQEKWKKIVATFKEPSKLGLDILVFNGCLN